MFYFNNILLFLLGKKKKKLTKYDGIVKGKKPNKKLKKVLKLKCNLPYIISPTATSSTPNNLCAVPSKNKWIETCVSPIMQQSSCASSVTPKSSLKIASPKDMFAIGESDIKANQSICDISALVARLNNLGLSPKINNYNSNIGHRRNKMKSMPGKRSTIYIPHTQVSSSSSVEVEENTQVSSSSSVEVEENNLGVFANNSFRNFSKKKPSISKIEDENLDSCSTSKILEENNENYKSVNFKTEGLQCTENVDNNADVGEFNDQGLVLDVSANGSQSEVCQIPISLRVSKRISCRISPQQIYTPKKDSSYNFDSFKEPQITLLPGKKWRKSFIKQKQSGK